MSSFVRLAPAASLLALLCACGAQDPGGFHGDAGDDAADASPGEGGVQCTSASECPTPALCQMCSNGRSVCSYAECIGGRCTVALPACQ